tara:strand:+ start:696 stop:1247 length:552 start_codon:yes stop_codon:yes gene_type:complete
MLQKKTLRKRYFFLRKKKYFEVNKDFFKPLVNLIKTIKYKEHFKIALYYPSNYEVNIIKLLDDNYMINKNILLPVVEDFSKMNFFSWKKNQTLLVNKFGMLEPVKTQSKVPNIIIVPILAFDKDRYRLGYGKGFYDRYLNKYLKRFKNILTVGVAFSFQKHHKLPIDKNDIKLNYILTEKGIH